MEEKRNRRRFKSLFLLFRGETWSLDQDSSSREVGEFETYQNVAIGCVRRRRGTLVENDMSPVWTAGWMVWPHTKKENRKREGEFSVGP